MRIVRLHALVLFCITWTSGCAAGDRATSDGVVFRDSVGIRIVENLEPTWTADDAWRIGAYPVVEIGVVDGAPEYQLSGISAVRRRANGELIVAQRTEIRLYDDAGRYLRTLGRAGTGPGEFQAINSVRECGGEVVALDWLMGRLTHFTEDGEVRRTVPLTPYRNSGIAVVALAGCALGNPVLWTTSVPDRRSTTPEFVVTRRPLTLVKLDTANSALDTLLSLPGSENLAGLNPPFGKQTLFALTESSIYATTNDDDEVRTYSLGGALERVIRRVLPPVEVTGADIARIREQYLGGLPPPLLQEIEPRFDAAPIPKTMPFYSQLLEDGTGHLWARAYYPFREGEEPRWSVYSPAGEWLGDVEFPAGLRVHEIGPDYVLGVWTDEMDVEYVRVYSIIR